MLIAQITDLHLGFAPGEPAEYNRKRLDEVLEVLIHGLNRPDLLLVTGDITDRGDDDSYRRAAVALGACPFPVYPMVGNHDDRTAFARHFPGFADDDGFIHYVVELGSLRLIVLDTYQPGRHGGAFCAARAAWLAERLDQDDATPTVIVMHHPPMKTGIAWMSTHPDEPWVRRFADTIAGRAQVRAILCGHLHRAIVAPWHGVTVTVCPATSPQLALDLRPIDPDRPDDRPMVIADPPGFALHQWTRHGLVTYFETADEHVLLARYDRRMQPVVRATMEEWPV